MILYKNDLSKNIKFLENSNNFVWIEIDKTCIKNMQNNLILVGTYINDTTSTYYHDDILEEFSSGILKYGSDSKPILLMGDFNGRVGNLDDRYIDDTPLTQNIPTQKPDFDIPTRKNCDIIANSHGKKIIQLCQSMNLLIINGRTIGDAIGNLTFMNASRGTSTIDYCLCNSILYKCIENFLVMPLTILK